MFPIVVATSKIGRSSSSSSNSSSSRRRSSSSSSRGTQYVPDLHEMSPILVLTSEIGRRDTICARFT